VPGGDSVISDTQSSNNLIGGQRAAIPKPQGEKVMSSTAPQAKPAPSPAVPQPPKEIRIYGHTALFYWWPVWVCGYIMAIATAVDGSRVAIVPPGSKYYSGSQDQGAKVVLPLGERIRDERIHDEGDLYEHMHQSKNLGVIFTAVLFVVILITNVPLRGLSSAIAITVILLITVVFAWQDWWSVIFGWLGRLNIHMNAGFYVLFSTALLVAWSLAFFLYDRMTYWRVTPGEITHEFVFGGGQKSFQTEGMAFEKLRDDLFRHWVLGFGSGDMIMHPMIAAGTKADELAIHNVLFVGTKLRQIQEMIAARPE
jgi:hypothetical protein